MKGQFLTFQLETCNGAMGYSVTRYARHIRNLITSHTELKLKRVVSVSKVPTKQKLFDIQ